MAHLFNICIGADLGFWMFKDLCSNYFFPLFLSFYLFFCKIFNLPVLYGCSVFTENFLPMFGTEFRTQTQIVLGT